MGQEISFGRILGGRDLGINQWPCPGKMAALPLSCVLKQLCTCHEF